MLEAGDAPQRLLSATGGSHAAHPIIGSTRGDLDLWVDPSRLPTRDHKLSANRPSRWLTVATRSCRSDVR